MSIQNYLNQIKTAVFGKDVRQSIHDAIKQCYDDASVDHDNANMEVKLARGTHETLNDRITENEKNQENLSSQLDTIDIKKVDKTDFNDVNNKKADIIYVDNKVSQIVSGSPKGKYDSLNDLNSAKPTGDEGIYLTLDDGNWNFWNGITWEVGGVYQSSKTDYQGVEDNTNLVLMDFNKYGGCSTFSVEGNSVFITNTSYGGVLANTMLNLNNIQNLYISMLLESEKEVYISFFDSANGYKNAIQIPTNGDGYVVVNKIITAEQIRSFGLTSNFKIGLLSNSLEWKMNYLIISSNNHNQETLEKEIAKSYKLIGDYKEITDRNIENNTKKYSQVVESNNMFNQSSLLSYADNESHSFNDELLTIKNNGYGGVTLGTFNLNGADYLYIDCIIKSQKAVDLGIMDTANGYKGAIRLSNGSAKDEIYKDKITKNIFINYGLTGDFKLVLLSSSLDWSVNHLLISNESYNANTLTLEIKKLDDTIRVLKDKTPNMNYIYVSKDYTLLDRGFGETKFNTLWEANNSIKYNSKDNPYTIIVKNGTYTDLNDRYSGVVSGADYQGIVTKDYVYYESENINRPDLCIIEFDGATGLINPTDSDIVTKAPFHIAHVSTSKSDLHTHIKGFTFKCKNTRYCMHIETQMRGLNVDWLVENCVFDWYGRPDTSDNTGIIPCVGMGMSPFETGKFKNCNFNNLEEGNNIGLMVHDNIFSSSYNYMPYMVIGAKLTLENCKFNGTDIICNTGHYNEFDTFNIINIINVRGINTAKVGLINGQSNHAWRSNVKCSEITNNQLV